MFGVHAADLLKEDTRWDIGNICGVLLDSMGCMRLSIERGHNGVERVRVGFCIVIWRVSRLCIERGAHKKGG